MTDLRHSHGTVALVISELGLLVGCDNKWRVFQIRESHTDGISKYLLKQLVDVSHALVAVAVLVLYTLGSREEQRLNLTRVFSFSQ